MIMHNSPCNIKECLTSMIETENPLQELTATMDRKLPNNNNNSNNTIIILVKELIDQTEDQT